MLCAPAKEEDPVERARLVLKWLVVFVLCVCVDVEEKRFGEVEGVALGLMLTTQLY